MAAPPRYGLACFDARKSKREKVFEPAVLEDRQASRRAHVLDLSSNGALGYPSRDAAVAAGIAWAEAAGVQELHLEILPARLP